MQCRDDEYDDGDDDGSCDVDDEGENDPIIFFRSLRGTYLRCLKRPQSNGWAELESLFFIVLDTDDNDDDEEKEKTDGKKQILMKF